ncbi:hypothetical protein KDH_79500 [Dictyobacter sp. S3.2.2.5]|uniref:Uncharacterized protein n=1 Tax=Dictyobacter halimunensis TaxID=3026934 RepID=A0ABQ6G8H9_9CHLR|nr:hypothetical protein KDH_79500 [Dictyobacter sp. S3.2.2.5]
MCNTMDLVLTYVIILSKGEGESLRCDEKMTSMGDNGLRDRPLKRPLAQHKAMDCTRSWFPLTFYLLAGRMSRYEYTGEYSTTDY